jgi:hypothetical protein
MPRKIKEVLPPLKCKNVQEYEQSDWWKRQSKLLLENKELVCPFCGRSRWIWQPRKKVWKRNLRFCVHHQTYENVPYEKKEDLIVCCSTCHGAFHQILRLEGVSYIFKELAAIVKKYFVYEKGSAGKNNYLNGGK